jgi:hypothetical protein
MKCLAGNIRLRHLALELGAVGAVSGHGLILSKARLSGQLLAVNLSASGGALHSGGQNCTPNDTLGRATQVAAADEFVSGLLPVVLAIRQTGANTLEAMSQALNQRGIRTARGGAWHASSVANLVVRARKISALQQWL